MTQEEIIEGNKLIAEFMGLQVIELNGELCDYKSMFTVEYHTSWDWLMPVVEKIEAIVDFIEMFFEKGHSEIRIWLSDDTIFPYTRVQTEKSKIQAAWLAVVEFIKWYNKEANSQNGASQVKPPNEQTLER